MVTKRYIERNGKTFGPYYYESYRDGAGKVKKRYLKDYHPGKDDKNYLKVFMLLIGIAVIVLLFLVFINQELSHNTLTGRTIYQAKEIYSPGELLTGDILFNLREGESIPKDTKISISLGNVREEFVLSDFIDYEPIQGTIYAESSQISGEGMVFGIPGVKRSYQEVEFQIEIYSEQETAEPPVEETPEPSPEENAQELQAETSLITGAVISETVIKIISGTTSKDSPFTYELEEGQKVRVVPGSVKSNSEILPENEISPEIKDNVLTITTEYALEERGFGEEFLGEENVLTFKINVADLELVATSGELVIQISYEGNEIAYYKDTILVAESPEATTAESPETIIQTKEIPSIHIPAGENVIIDLSEYFTGAAWFSAEIENIQVAVEGNLMRLTPEQDFKGTRKIKITARNEQQTIESNEFLILVSSGAVTIKTSHEKIKVGQPVKWKKEIIKEQAEEEFKIEIPKKAKNVEVKAIKTEWEGTIEQIPDFSSITGDVVIEVNLKERNKNTQSDEPVIKNLKTWFVSFKTQFNKKMQMPLEITGRSVDEIPVPAEVVDIYLEEPDTTEYIIEYETPAPQAVEEETENGKLITIYAEIEGYTDIIAFTELDNTVSLTHPDRIKLYWHNYEYEYLTEEEITKATSTKTEDIPDITIVEEISTTEESPVLAGSVTSNQRIKSSDFVREEIIFDSYDLDQDGFIDYIEWVVPHLSNQTYELIIEITNAEHLDENRAFVSDIFPSVSALDNVWSEIIPQNHYVRVTFETELSSDNDITLYPRTVSGTPQIEVYEKNSGEIIATFSTITDNQYNKVYLTALQAPQKTFDLKVVNGAIEIDHIIDPTDGPPRINFSPETTPSGTQSNNDIYVEISTEDESDHYVFANFNNSLLYWVRFDDFNESGNPTNLATGENGTVLNGPLVIDESSGYWGNGSFFAKTTRSAQFTRTNFTDINQTVSVWVNPSSRAATNIICSNNGNNLADFRVLINANGAIIFRRYIGSGSSFQSWTTPNDLVDINQWSHIAGVFNGTDFLIYSGGTEVSTTRSTGTQSLGTGPFTISDSLLGATAFNGSIDELIVFDRQLTPGEIKALYNASANQYSNNFTELANETYSFMGFAVDKVGNRNQTELRTVTIGEVETVPPSIEFVQPTPADDSIINLPFFSVNMSTNSSADHYSFLDLDKSVLLWMRMDDVNASGDPTDLSSYGNNGTRIGNATQSEGYFGKGFYFNGTGGNIVIPELSNGGHSYDSGNFSVSFWIKTEVSDQPVISDFKEGELFPGSGWRIFLNNNGRVSIAAGGITSNPPGGALVANNAWHHVVVVYRGDTDDGGNTTLIYIDNSLNRIFSLVSPIQSDEERIFVIGGTAQNPNFNGTLDEVLLFNRSLSAEEISSLFNASAHNYFNEFAVYDGNYSFKGYVSDRVGQNSTEERRIEVVVPAPAISFIEPTTENNSLSLNSIYVNLSTFGYVEHYSFVDFNRDVLLWMRMDDVNASGDPTDLSSYGNNGTRIGNATQTDGYFGTGFNFPFSSYINVSTSAMPTGAYTKSAWIKLTGSNIYSLAKDIISGDAGTHTFWVQDGGNLAAGNIVSINVFDEEFLEPNTWYHVAVTFDPAVENGKMVLYKNGLAVNSSTNVMNQTIGNRLYIGMYGEETELDVDEAIDEVIIFSRALNESEILALYSSSEYSIDHNYTLADGVYDFQGFAVDKGGKRNQTEIRTVTVGEIDITPPIITVISPVNNSKYNSETLLMTVSLNESGSWCGYSLNGEPNISLTKVNETYFSSESSPPEGYNNVIFTCNDTSNNFATTPTIYFLFDITAPSINFTSPTPENNSTQNSTSIYVNISTNDANDHYSFVDFNRDVLLWMRMDDVNASGDPLDLSSWGNNGTRYGNAVQNDSGYFGKGYQFGMSDDFIEDINDVVDAGNIFPSGAYTASAWIKKDRSFNYIQHIFAGCYGVCYALFVKDTGIGPHLAAKNINLAETFVEDTEPIENGIWYFVAVSYNPEDGNLTLYKNSEVVASETDIPLPEGTRFLIGSSAEDQGGSTLFFMGLIDEVLLFNRTLSDGEIKALYNASANQYSNNFTELAEGVYNFQGFTTDKVGNRNQTELRTVTISEEDTLPPSIEFILPTPNNGARTDSQNLTIAVNVTTYNSTTLDTLIYRVYNSSIILINETYTSELSLTLVGLTPDTYFYSVWVNDSAGKNSTTPDRSITILPSCFNLPTECIEDSACLIEQDCYLYSEMCTNNECSFTVMTTNATIYTFYDEDGNGRNLRLTLTSNAQRAPLTFLSEGRIVFSGRDGSDTAPGSSGGNGGIVNITVPDLFNTINAVFIGTGGYNSRVGGSSGNGGHLILNFRGLIQNYSNTPPPAPAPSLTRGDGLFVGGFPGGGYGTDGTLTYNRDVETCPRDADITGDGQTNVEDIFAIRGNYNKGPGEVNFNKQMDIDCNNKANVEDITRIGFEWETRNLE